MDVGFRHYCVYHSPTWISIITTLAVFLFAYAVFAQSPAGIEERAAGLERRLQGATDIHELIRIYGEAMNLMNEANQAAAPITGIQAMPIEPSATPEKEMERRREIINKRFGQAKQKAGVFHGEGDEKIQIPAEALPIEGYILVEGGEQNFFYNKLETDLLYTIKETFVGNLTVLKTYDPKKGSFTTEKGFSIDSLSTDIKVPSVLGKKCVRWSSGSPSVCTRWANFLRYEIDRGERYPRFNAGVVLATPSENGQITLEARAPEIVFRGDDGITNLTMGCFNATWTLNRADLEILLDHGSVTLRKDVGRPIGPSPGCRPGSTMTLHIKVKQPVVDPCKNGTSVELRIVSPHNKEKYVFDDGRNMIVMGLEAKTVPDHYADSVEWIIPEIKNSYRTITPSSASYTRKGRSLEVIYEGLPEDYNEFGPRTIRATLMVDGCRIEDTKEVQFFYPRDAKNNPEGRYPNWFYYWKQTPAGRPFGQNVRIEYHCTGIPMDKCQCLHHGVIGQYNSYYSGHKTVNVCDLKTNTWDPNTFWVKMPAVKRSNPSTLLERNFFAYTYIDTFAVAVMHEFTHFNNYLTFWPDGWKENEDTDGDDIPDRLELGMGFSPTTKQTYWREHDLGDDEEFLTLEATYDYQPGTFDKYDWARPGKNWPFENP